METEKTILTKDQILAADDLPTEQVWVPEWNGHVFVRTLTGLERDQIEAAVVGDGEQKNLHNLRAKIISLAAVDAEGKRLFSFQEAEQLGQKSARALDRLFSVAQRLSGFTKKDVEDLSKKSSPSPADDSISG